ncbi:hypothetical protein BZA05DRAFT_236522 [Tricharina praecox]|uniref:uncharacterized protein n=1 Tax=Tricharina praecox TaxID=43433 RepID=UPI00221ED315|nr:uncharacterized protein BZA05DRAFT_236522 [Tricharina praecox]KAI5855299.1 hypothetical protein BZA05DRAFT_236522 [Tricharina praecox]
MYPTAPPPPALTPHRIPPLLAPAPAPPSISGNAKWCPSRSWIGRVTTFTPTPTSNCFDYSPVSVHTRLMPTRSRPSSRTYLRNPVSAGSYMSEAADRIRPKTPAEPTDRQTGPANLEGRQRWRRSKEDRQPQENACSRDLTTVGQPAVKPRLSMLT